jgi:nitroimidazol reductase NimA-like FMN-containing flavoprotein (pyridoxamine 5'-phosphate oxidase superfamily)
MPVETLLRPTDRTTLRRRPMRGSYERAAVYRILDEALVCHVGFVAGGTPVVIPTAYGRVGDTLLVHGAAASRMLKALAGGIDVCVTVTLVDGLVLARSAFHHSMNYRSVVIFGRARIVIDPDEKLAGLRAITEHLVPGRWAHVRPPTPQELNATSVLALALDEASAKARSGPPIDDADDYALPVWAGVIPMRLTPLAVVPDDRMPAGVTLPAHVTTYRRERADACAGEPVSASIAIDAPSAVR